MRVPVHAFGLFGAAYKHNNEPSIADSTSGSACLWEFLLPLRSLSIQPFVGRLHFFFDQHRASFVVSRESSVNFLCHSISQFPARSGGFQLMTVE